MLFIPGIKWVKKEMKRRYRQPSDARAELQRVKRLAPKPVPLPSRVPKPATVPIDINKMRKRKPTKKVR